MVRLTFEVPFEPRVLQRLVDALAAVGQSRRIPPLYASGVSYRREPRTELWLPWWRVLELGYGDCEDLVAWRVGYLRQQGESARAHCYAPRPGLVHCVVRRADGKLEDPSRRLGMGKKHG